MVQSKWCYPGTTVLVNHANIRNQEELTRFENAVTTARLAQLKLHEVKGNFDLEHLRKIHQHIFQDVYPFAGKIRDENIAKENFSFANAQYIEPQANQLFRDLMKENCLRGLNKDDFADRAAHYAAEINVLHPFREGNGRTQREYVRCLANNAGYELDLTRFSRDELMSAFKKSVSDTRDLSRIFRSSLTDREQSLDRGMER